MAKLKQVVIVDNDKISLYLNQEVLAPLEASYSINYFSEKKKALNFIRNLESSYSLFISAKCLIEERELLFLIKEASTPSEIFILSLEPDKDKGFLTGYEFLPFVQKPLTANDLLKYLGSPLA